MLQVTCNICTCLNHPNLRKASSSIHPGWRVTRGEVVSLVYLDSGMVPMQNCLTLDVGRVTLSIVDGHDVTLVFGNQYL